MNPAKPGLTLAELAAATALSQADVALFSELSTSTISRIWADPDWLSRVSGSTLTRLITSVPGVEDYLCSPPQARSRERD